MPTPSSTVPTTDAAPTDSRPVSLEGWHARARAMAFERLPATMNAVHSYVAFDNGQVGPLLYAAVAWNVKDLSKQLGGGARAAEGMPLDHDQAMLDTALTWALNATPRVIKTDNPSGVPMLGLTAWTPVMLDARETTLALLLGHGARVTGPAMVAALSPHHGPVVLAQLLAANASSPLDVHIPRTLGLADGVLHQVARNTAYSWALPMLVNAGADLNEQVQVLHKEKLSALGVAAQFGHVELCERMVQLGALPLQASSLSHSLVELALGPHAKPRPHPQAATPLRILEERWLLHAACAPSTNTDSSRPRSRQRL